MMKNRKILFHANRLRTSGYISEFENKIMAEFFKSLGWDCFFADWADINAETLRVSYILNSQTGDILTDIHLNEIADVIIARKIGSVESRIEQFKNYLQELINNFRGIVINDPKAMIYGMRKDYIFLLQERKFPVISSHYFEKSASYKTLLSYINNGNSSDWIIKPITGECGNSVDLVSNYNEEILRHKEGKIGGWIIQPKVKDIVLGEHSLIYIDGELSHAVKKIPQGESLKVNARWQPQCELYIPTNKERILAEAILNFWPYKLLTVRIDLVQDGDTIRIMEVETVNPGFYLDKIPSQKLKEALNRLECLISKLLRR